MNGLSAPSTKAGRTQRVVLDLLREHARTEHGLPTTARFVFYELEQRGDAVKPDPADQRRNRRRSHGWPPGAQDVTDALTHLRDQGVIPWEWIADEERQLTVWDHAGSVVDYVRERLDKGRINPWDGPPPLVLTESKATASAMRPLTSEYLCPVGGIKGQSNGFLRTAVARHLRGDEAERPIAYLGDLDKSGHDIERNTEAVLRDEGWQGTWHRLAMTEQLAEAHDITPIWKVDGRTDQGHRAVEVESLGQAGLVTLLRSYLDDLLPEPLTGVLEREQEQREQLAEVLDGAS